MVRLSDKDISCQQFLNLMKDREIRHTFLKITKGCKEIEIQVWRKWIETHNLSPSRISGMNLQSTSDGNLSHPPFSPKLSKPALESICLNEKPFISVEKLNTVETSSYTKIDTEVLNTTSKAICKISTSTTKGTGFVADINNEVKIITAYHVIKNATEESISVELGSNTYSVSTIDYKGNPSSYYDVAVLTIRENLPENILPLKLCQQIRPGNEIALFGYPHTVNKDEQEITQDSESKLFPHGGRYNLCVSFGKVTKLEIEFGEHNANSLKGNSGGPVINSDGQFIGIHTNGITEYSTSNVMQCGDCLVSFLNGDMPITELPEQADEDPSDEDPSEDRTSFLDKLKKWAAKAKEFLQNVASTVYKQLQKLFDYICNLF